MSMLGAIAKEWGSLKNEVNKTGIVGATKKIGTDLASGMMIAGGVLGKKAYASEGDGNTSALDSNNTQNGVWQGPVAQKPSDLGAPSKNSAAGQAKAQKDADAKQKKNEKEAKDIANEVDEKRIAAINSGYNNLGGEFDRTQNSVNASKTYIGNLGKVANNYRTSIENFKNKQDTAIAGNKTMIENNQKKELDNLAGDLRENNAKTNVMLGAASNGSAGRAFARLAAQNAGKARATILTTQGDKMSYQKQASINAKETYDKDRASSYEWEKTAMEDEMAKYQEQVDALDGLRNSQSGWRAEDIAIAGSQNLSNLKTALFGIQAKGEAFRSNLAAKNEEYGGKAEELDNSAIGVDAPAELNTPKFSEDINLTDPNNTEDFFDPNKTPAKVIIGYDAAGNPIYGDAPISAPVTV